MTEKICDVLIVGSGLVGGTLALALSKLPLKIIMIEQEPFVDKATAAYDDRGIAVSPASKNILDTLGLWQPIQKTAQPISQIHVSEQKRFAKTVLKAKEMDTEALGFVCSGITLGRVINAHLKSCDNIERIMPASLIDIIDGVAKIKSEAGKIEIHAQIIAGVDGAKSKVRELLKIKTRVKKYDHLAITCNLSFEKEHKGYAFERFTQDGPLAILPLINNKSALVWTISNRQAKGLMALESPQFIEKLQQQFGFRLGAINKIGQLASYPLVLRVAEKLTKNNVVLLGNAAQTLHPVAGQGFNLGMRDMANLYESIKIADEQKTSLVNSLKAYAKGRVHDRNRVIFLSESLPSIFTNDSFIFKVGRNVGLLGFSSMPFARKMFAQRAMGKNGRATFLQRGILG